jgi:hypothetical protein
MFLSYFHFVKFACAARIAKTKFAKFIFGCMQVNLLLAMDTNNRLCKKALRLLSALNEGTFASCKPSKIQ